MVQYAPQQVHACLALQAVERTRTTVKLRRLAAATSASPRMSGPAGGGIGACDDSAASGDCAGASEEAPQHGPAEVSHDMGRKRWH